MAGHSTLAARRFVRQIFPRLDFSSPTMIFSECHPARTKRPCVPLSTVWPPILHPTVITPSPIRALREQLDEFIRGLLARATRCGPKPDKRAPMACAQSGKETSDHDRSRLARPAEPRGQHQSIPERGSSSASA